MIENYLSRSDSIGRDRILQVHDHWNMYISESCITGDGQPTSIVSIIFTVSRSTDGCLKIL